MQTMRNKLLYGETIVPLLSKADLQLLLNVGPNAADRLMKALPHINIAPPGSQREVLRMRREDFDAFIAQRTREALIGDT